MSRANRTSAVFLAFALLGAASALGAKGAPKGAPKEAAAGAKMDVNQLKEYLASEGLYSSEEVRRDLDRVQARPLGNPRLTFAVLVPKGWEDRPLGVSKEQIAADREKPVPLLEMGPRGKGSKEAVLEVRYMRVAADVTLERFLLTYAHASGFEILGRLRGTFNGRAVEEALLRMKDPQGVPYLTRLTVSRRGELLFMVAGSAREADFGKWRRPFGAAAVSFEPTG